MWRFIDRVRFYTTTENYADIDDLVRRVKRRLAEQRLKLSGSN